MTAEQRRLKRTRLIERVRTVEQRQSALAAAEAETQRARLDAVSAKTRALAAHYAASRDATDAQSLRRSGTVVGPPAPPAGGGGIGAALAAFAGAKFVGFGG